MKRWLGSALLVLTWAVLAPVEGVSAADPGVEVSAPVTPTVSAPLWSLPDIGVTGARPDAEPRLTPPMGGRVRAERTAGSIDRGPAISRMPSPNVEFTGMTWASTAGYTPADANADVGPDHIVQMVNSSVQIFDKTGSSLAGPSDLASFWSTTGTECDTVNDGDPIVLYDEAADRWLISQFTSGGPTYYECIAISTTADPTGTWYQYAFETSTTKFPDYPKFGVWDDSYYMTANLYNGSVDAGVYAFERDQMLAGNPATMQKKTVSGAYGLLPADLDGPTAPPASTPGTFVAYINGSPDRLRVYEFDVDWTTPANTTFTTAQNLTVDDFDNVLCASTYYCIPQPGTSVKLDAITDLLMYRVGYRNFGAHADMVVVHTVDVNGRGAIRWYHLRQPTGGSWSVQDSGTWSSGSMYRWIPTAAMDEDGNIAIGYNVSNGSSVYPGLRYAGRLSSDPAGTLGQGESVLINGGGSQTNSYKRWGDYASMSVDPADDCTFWFTGMYQPTSADLDWRTRIGSFKFPSCGKPKVSAGDRKLDEGDSGTTAFRFRIALSEASGSTVTVDWETVEGTAHAPSDYSSTSGTVTFSPGQTVKRVKVLVNGDGSAESNETFKVKLSGATNSAITDGQGTGTIRNDD